MEHHNILTHSTTCLTLTCISLQNTSVPCGYIATKARSGYTVCPAIVLSTADAGDGKAADILADNLEADPNSIELSATTILPPLN
jgi:hypothetical protein